MNEYWLLLLLVSLGAVLAWTFFWYLARLAIWSSRPTLDACRYGLITGCLVVEIGNTFEVWEAALLAALSMIAYRVVWHERTRFESAMSELRLQARKLTDAKRGDERSIRS